MTRTLITKSFLNDSIRVVVYCIGVIICTCIQWLVENREYDEVWQQLLLWHLLEASKRV